ncbi:MAG TPA: rhodanese-like domain-containing protein [Acidimicrobiales bacterium]|jgi:rhodanese-related sulfurtransferase
MSVPRFSEIDVDELDRRRNAGVVGLIDVRQPHEYEEVHVPGAVLIPFDQLADRLHELPEGELVVICRTGARSAMACEVLTVAGRDATNVAGGTMAWVEGGFESATGPQPS